MSRKKTTSEVRSQLVEMGNGIELIDEYVTAQTKVTFRCRNSHDWLAKPNDVLTGHGCPDCAGLRRSSKEKVNKKLDEAGRSVRQLGEYKSALTKTLFRCEVGHEWMVKPNVVLSGAGCPVCSDTSWTVETINKRFEDANRPITIIGEYKNFVTNTEFQCDNGHIWKTALSNLFKNFETNKSGCPTCAVYGFKPDIPAVLYILKFDSFIKYGITNDLKSRLCSHRKAGEFTIELVKEFDKGQHAMILESSIKKAFGGNFIGPDIMKNGYTETLSLAELENLIEYCS